MNLAIPKGNGRFHSFINENLEVGDEVFPFLDTYHPRGEGELYITDLRFEFVNGKFHTSEAVTGWPGNPHTVLEFFDDYGVTYIKTDKGRGPAEAYFKLKEPLLKPCPFCGKNAVFLASNWVRCEDTVNCGAEIDIGGHGQNTRQFVIDTWNRREVEA